MNKEFKIGFFAITSIIALVFGVNFVTKLKKPESAE